MKYKTFVPDGYNMIVACSDLSVFKINNVVDIEKEKLLLRLKEESDKIDLEEKEKIEKLFNSVNEIEEKLDGFSELTPYAKYELLKDYEKILSIKAKRRQSLAGKYGSRWRDYL